MIAKQSLWALAVLCASGVSASGQVESEPVVLFDNFGPGDRYDAGVGWSFGSFFGNTQLEQAVAFTVDDNFFLTSGVFAVSMDFDLSTVFGPFEIAVHASDEDGLPGAVLEEVTVNEGVGLFGFPNPPLAVRFAGTTALNAGEQYWINMSAPTGMFAVWNSNNQGDMGLLAVSVDGGPWTTSSGVFERPVFRLQGTLVPVPGAIGILGIFACASRRRRRVAADV